MTRATGAVVCAASTAALLGLCAAAAATGAAPSWVALIGAAAMVPWAGAWVLGDALGPRGALGWGLGLAATAGLALAIAPPVLSDDVFRYLWDARVLRAGIDPYRHPPDAPALAPLRDALWSRVNHPEIPTIYPPLAQLTFAVADLVAHAPWSFKALALLAHLGAIPLVAHLARSREARICSDTPPHRRVGTGGDAHVARATLGFALAPLALIEAASSGHADALAGLLLAAAVLALVRARPWLAAAFAGLASGVKLVGLLVAPLVAARHRGAGVLAFVLTAAPLFVLAHGGSAETTNGLGHYTRRWRGNEGAFALVERTLGTSIEALGRAQGAPRGRIRLHGLAPLLDRTRGTSLDPRAGLQHTKKQVHDPHEYQAPYIAGLLARGVVVVLVFGLAIALVRLRVSSLMAARLVVLVSLLLAPQLHPWYLLWLLPLELAAGGLAGLVLAAALPLTYAPLDAWLRTRSWNAPTAGVVTAHALAWTALAFEALQARRCAKPQGNGNDDAAGRTPPG
jgi:hypothetical protein